MKTCKPTSTSFFQWPISSGSVQILFSPCSLWGPVSPPYSLVRPSDSLCCLPQLWTDRVAPERTLLLSLLWLLSGAESHHLGPSVPLQPLQACIPVLSSPDPSSLRVSALPGKLRTWAGHLLASMGTKLSAQLTETSKIPSHSAVWQGQGWHVLETSIVEGTRLPSNDWM